MESVGLEPTHGRDLCPPKALPTELRLLFVPSQDVFPPFDRTHTDWVFFWNMFYFNNNVDDTGDNRLDTISSLDLQSIVEGVDRLDGHCLHNHDQKSHLKRLARYVHGLWLSSTTTRNRHMTC